MADDRERTAFVVCIDATECEDLQVRRLYRVVEDGEAASHGMLRIVDDSGEDYLYPGSRFVSVPLPDRVEKVLAESA